MYIYIYIVFTYIYFTYYIYYNTYIYIYLYLLKTTFGGVMKDWLLLVTPALRTAARQRDNEPQRAVMNVSGAMQCLVMGWRCCDNSLAMLSGLCSQCVGDALAVMPTRQIYIYIHIYIYIYSSTIQSNYILYI